MVARKKTIPPTVHAGSFTGLNVIPSGTIYAGQIVGGVGVGNMTGGDYSPGTFKPVPIVQAIQAATVKASGTTKYAVLGAATTPVSGSGIFELYKVLGVATQNAPVQDTYQQFGAGKPIADPTNVTQYIYDYDTDVRRFGMITESDACQVWLPYSGTALSGTDVGKYLTLSSGVNGAVELATSPATQLTVGQVLGYATDTTFSGATVPGISAYVLTRFELR